MQPLTLDSDGYITCNFRQIKLIPGWYKLQSFTDRPRRRNPHGWWKDGTKMGAVQRHGFLIKRRATYDWKVCGDIHQYRTPLRLGRHTFKYYVSVDSDLIAPPGQPLVRYGAPDPLESPVTLFPTNSRDGTFLVGSRLFRTRD